MFSDPLSSSVPYAQVTMPGLIALILLLDAMISKNWLLSILRVPYLMCFCFSFKYGTLSPDHQRVKASPTTKSPGLLTAHDKEPQATHVPASEGLRTTAVPLKGDCTRANVSKSSCWNGASQVFDSVNYCILLACQPGFSTEGLAMWNLLPVALPLSPHLAASRRHFKRCFCLL